MRKGMTEKELEGVLAKYPDGMSEEEATEYVKRGKEKYGKHLKGIEIKIPDDDANDVELYYDTDRMPFSRIRRITGYLVGNLDRFNNAKRAEEHDRVKHGV